MLNINTLIKFVLNEWDNRALFNRLKVYLCSQVPTYHVYGKYGNNHRNKMFKFHSHITSVWWRIKPQINAKFQYLNIRLKNYEEITV